MSTEENRTTELSDESEPEDYTPIVAGPAFYVPAIVFALLGLVDLVVYLASSPSGNVVHGGLRHYLNNLGGTMGHWVLLPIGIGLTVRAVADLPSEHVGKGIRAMLVVVSLLGVSWIAFVDTPNYGQRIPFLMDISDSELRAEALVIESNLRTASEIDCHDGLRACRSSEASGLPRVERCTCECGRTLAQAACGAKRLGQLRAEKSGRSGAGDVPDPGAQNLVRVTSGAKQKGLDDGLECLGLRASGFKGPTYVVGRLLSIVAAVSTWFLMWAWLAVFVSASSERKKQKLRKWTPAAWVRFRLLIFATFTLPFWLAARAYSEWYRGFGSVGEAPSEGHVLGDTWAAIAILSLFFVVVAALLFAKKQGPTAVAIVLAVGGLLAVVGFVKPEMVWALASLYSQQPPFGAAILLLVGCGLLVSLWHQAAFTREWQRVLRNLVEQVKGGKTGD